jgi:hypothetical protein
VGTPADYAGGFAYEANVLPKPGQRRVPVEGSDSLPHSSEFRRRRNALVTPLGHK